MKLRSIGQGPTLSMSLAAELAGSVKDKVRKKWNDKITQGLIPAEVNITSDADRECHEDERRFLGIFETLLVEEILFERESRLTSRQIHYFGIGTGNGLEYLIPSMNRRNYTIVAYDSSDVATRIARNLFDRTPRRAGTEDHEVYEADIKKALSPRYIRRGKARLIVASRVIDVLDKQVPDWEKQEPHERKGAIVLNKMGTLIAKTGVEILLIQRLPEANEGRFIKWRDTTPHTLQEIHQYMQAGSSVELAWPEQCATVEHHGHAHTALICGQKGR